MIGLIHSHTGDIAESRDAMLNEALERCCQDMIARGEYTSHPNFVLTKHDGPNATAMMARDIIRLYMYATRQTDDFPRLKSPSKAPNNMSQTIIEESDEVTSCDISNLVNSIPETPNTVILSPNTDPESPVFPKHTIQCKNKLHYGTTKSAKENEQPMLDVYFSDTADKDNTPNCKKNKSHESSDKEDDDLHRSPKECSWLRGLEQKIQETTDKNTKLVKQIRGLRQQSMRQRKENIKLIKGCDSLMTEKKDAKRNHFPRTKTWESLKHEAEKREY